MIRHTALGANAAQRTRRLHSLIRSGAIALGGNARLKIYGTLHCKSGKRMKTDNRVFFASPAQARAAGYRPCGHCLKKEYRAWRNGW